MLHLYENDWIQRNKLMFLAVRCLDMAIAKPAQQRVQKRSHHKNRRRADTMNKLHQNIRKVSLFG